MSYVPKVGRGYAYETDCPAWKCPHISVHDWGEGRRCPERPCTCPESAELSPEGRVPMTHPHDGHAPGDTCLECQGHAGRSTEPGYQS